MASIPQHLLDMHAHAMSNLERKLALIPARMFPSGRKPTISDVYANNEATLTVPSIPRDFQLEFFFMHYATMASSSFTVSKSSNWEPINFALWYWNVDQSHSFSSVHRQVRYNILMACIVRASPTLSANLPASALTFADALVNAWLWAVTRQSDCSKQEQFLDIWSNGPHDLMFFGRKARDRMESAVRQLGAYVPKIEAPGGDGVGFWDSLEATDPSRLSTFGPAWAMAWIVQMEQTGRHIEGLDREAQVDKALAEGGFEAAFSNVGLEQAPSQLSEELFRQPLVQALLSEGDEDVAMGEEEEEEGVASRPIPDKGDVWMDPAEAIAILNGTSKKYESMKDLFSKVDWE